MRLASYNILDGGEGRADPLTEVLIAQRADIIVLVEADDAAVLERIAGRMEMDFVHGQGQKSSDAILSRWPIRDSINHAPLRKNISKSLLEATIAQPSGPQWIVGAVHLHARATAEDEDTRLTELADVMDVFASRRRDSLPHLLAGDFNANAPIQRIDPARCKEATRRAWEANVGKIPRRVVQKLLDAGYLDSLQVSRGEAAGDLGTFSTQCPGQRVDYIFTYGVAPARITAAWVERDRLAQFASDHYPVGVEIQPD